MARNRTFNEISIGDTATIHRVCTANDLVIFAHASGNLNPLSLPHDKDRDGHSDPDTVAPSMWVGSQFSAILGNSLPGAGTKYLSQTLSFHERVHVGDELVLTVTVTEKREPGIVILSCTMTNQWSPTASPRCWPRPTISTPRTRHCPSWWFSATKNSPA
jgi:phosphate butyryltransferase